MATDGDKVLLCFFLEGRFCIYYKYNHLFWQQPGFIYHNMLHETLTLLFHHCEVFLLSIQITVLVAVCFLLFIRKFPSKSECMNDTLTFYIMLYAMLYLCEYKAKLT